MMPNVYNGGMSVSARLLAVLSAAVVAALLLAAPITGTWKGKVLVDASKLPKLTNPEQQKKLAEAMSQVAKMRINLNLNVNKTFKAQATGVPGKPGQPQTTEGTWKQEGDVIWLTSTKDNNGPAKDKKPQKVQVLESGKKLKLVPGPEGQGITIIFTR